MKIVAIVLIGLFLLFIGLVVGYILPRRRRRSKTLRDIQDTLDLEKPSEHRMTGTWKDHSIEVEFDPGGRNRVSSMTVFIANCCENAPVATIRQETWWDQFAKSIGLAEEIQAGTDSFDQELYIECDDEQFKTFIDNPSVRKLLNSLIQTRKNHVEITHGGARWETTINSFGFWKSFSGEYVQNLLKAFQELDRICAEQFEPEGDTENGHTTDTAQSEPEQAALSRQNAWNYTINPTSVILMLGFALFYWSRTYSVFTYSLYKTGLIISGGVLLCYLPFGFVKLRGTSRSHNDFLLFLIISVIGVPLFICSGLIVLNVTLDFSQSQWVNGTVIEVFEADDAYHAEVRVDNTSFSGTPKITISPNTFKRLQKKEQPPARVQVYEGFLKEPWVHQAQFPK